MAIGAASGAVAFWAGMPLPWMLGAMLGTTIAALAGSPLAAPVRLRQVAVPVLGVMLGSAVTPDLMAQAGHWALMLVPLPPLLAGFAGASYLIYRHIGGYDAATAYYSAMPGGLNEMMILGAAAGGSERRIALAHACRILMVISAMALIFGLVFGVRTTGAAGWTPFSDLGLRDAAILLACAGLGPPLARAMRLPAAPVFGPMILSGAVHVAGWVTLPPPSALIVIAQVVIGTVIGARFIGTQVAEVGRDLWLAFLSTLALLAIACGVSVAIAALLGVPLEQSLLAFAPGGLTEMSLLTLALDQDVAFVSLTHILRIAMVIAVAAPVFARVTNAGK